MSSYYTTVSCKEWEQMENTIRAADAFQVRSQAEIARLNELNAERRKELAKIRGETGRVLEAAQDCLILSFRSATSQLNQQFRDQMGSQADGFDKQLHELRAAAADISKWTADASAAIDRLATEYSKAVSGLLNNQPQESKRAYLTLVELDKLLDRLRELQPEGQNRAVLDSLDATRGAAASNISSGDYQAALILTQDSILSASRALTSTIVAREQYESRMADIQREFLNLETKVSFLASKEGTISYELGDERYECDYDINYWSHGIFEELTKQVSTLGSDIQQASKVMVSTKHLSELTGKVRSLFVRVEKCDMEARRDLAGTMAMENTVQRLYSGLEERGWSLESSGHQDGDSRKPYAMTFLDGAGNTVSVVGASGERPEIPSFFYEVFSDNEGMANIVKGSITSTLQSVGLDIESSAERDDCSQNTSPDAFVERIATETSHASLRRHEALRREVESIG